MASSDSINQSDQINSQFDPVNNEPIPKNPYFLSPTTVSIGDGVPNLMNGVVGVASSVGVPAGTVLAATISHHSTSTSYLEIMARPCSFEHNWSG
ncbi:hypothetical protein CMV_010299 [Castanea mollissima]|uniref:Uncharacterized protein n=1 Tax=Castanea mollissima TaxID=60419 RepID=A0A8J4RN38_9ROSI|nr:hypothetical protein CMV_010299 [Castanea mollissima]